MRVGIDLGTTYCAIAYVDPETGKAKVIKNAEGSSITPSVLYFSPDGQILHGEEAKVYVEEGSDRTANYFKYHMGDPDYRIEQNGKEYTATDLSAELLKGVVREAEDYLGENIYDAVITVPAYFDHFQRQATMEAGRKAGLNVLSIISEPTAAAFAYGINGKGTNQTVLVYDLGGGTFDVTIAKIMDDEIQVLGTDGDHQLGGKNWDDALANYLADQFYEEFDVDISADVTMNITMQAIAENTKKQLTAKHRHNAVIQYQGQKGVYEVTEEIFEDITAYNLNRTKDIIEKLMGELNMCWSDIDGVLLVGGSTRMRQVRKYLTEMCGRPPMSGVNVDEAVALGAAIRANIDIDGKLAIGAVPTRFSLGGASRPEFSIAGAKKIRDATAHSMGMIAVNRDTTHYVNSIMIKKNSPIPSEVTKQYELGMSRREENRLEVYMLQGEEEELTYPLNCIVLGKYVFTGLQQGDDRTEKVDVTFSYDENNIVNVSAVQTRTGISLNLHIEPVEEDMSWVVMDPKERMKAEGKEVKGDMSVLLAIDLSGSMAGKRIEEAKKAASSFVKQFDKECTDIGIINFADQCILYQPLTRNERELLKKINNWDIKGISSGGLGYGNDAEPFTEAFRIFKRNKSQLRYVVVLTDGYWSHAKTAILAAKKCHQAGIDVIALGFGSANRKFLDEIASKKDFASFTDISKLENVLTGIAKIM